jgi:hypothetical protein
LQGCASLTPPLLSAECKSATRAEPPGCSCATTEHPEPDAARQVVIYIGDEASAEELRKGALSSFNVALPSGVEVVALAEAALLAPERYPRFTLVGQTVGSVRLGLAALRRLVPEVRRPQPHALHSLACTDT